MSSIIVMNLLWISVTITLATAYLLEGIKTSIVEVLAVPYDAYMTKLLWCSQCIGFWVGLAGAFLYEPTWIELPYSWMAYIAQGFITSFLSYCVSYMLGLDKEE